MLQICISTSKSQNSDGGTTFYGGPAVEILTSDNGTLTKVIPAEFHYLSNGYEIVLPVTKIVMPAGYLNSELNLQDLNCLIHKQTLPFSVVVCGPERSAWKSADTFVALCDEQNNIVCSMAWGNHLFIRSMGQVL